MIVKFHRHGTGPASGALDYLLKEKGEPTGENTNKTRIPLQPRAHARVLSGDPFMTEHLINSTSFKQKYKSGVLSFTERANEVTEENKFQIMQKFEDTIFCGLDRDQYDILWIEHADKDIDKANPIGRLELNFLIAGQELRSGARFQPFYSKADLVRVNAFKDIVNYDYKLTDPNEPERKRLVNPYSNDLPPPTPYDEQNYTRKEAKKDEDIISDPRDRKALRDAINRRMKFAYQEGLISNRLSVIFMLKQWGLKIERDKSESSLSISNKNIADKNGKPLHVRLKGAMYEKSFDGINHRPHIVELEQKAYKSRLPKEIDQAQKTLAKGIQIKEKYHAELYADAELLEPLRLDVVEVDIVNTEKDISVAESQPERQIYYSGPSL